MFLSRKYRLIVDPRKFDVLKGTGKRGHIVGAETLLLMTFPFARKLGNSCCGHKIFLKKIRNIFVSRAQYLCPQQMLRARANGETFVSATMCRQQCVLVCQYLKTNMLLFKKIKSRKSQEEIYRPEVLSSIDRQKTL